MPDDTLSMLLLLLNVENVSSPRVGVDLAHIHDELFSLSCWHAVFQHPAQPFALSPNTLRTI